MHSNDYITAQSLLLQWWCGPAVHSLSRRSFNSFTSSHHGSANGRPSLEGYPRCCSPPDWRIWWPHLWRDKLCASLSLQHGDSVTCTVNGMISVTSTLRHQVRDVHGTQRSKFTSMISIHLQSCVPKIIKIRIYLWKLLWKKSVAPFLSGHGVGLYV